MKYYKKFKSKLGVVVHTYNPSTLGAMHEGLTLSPTGQFSDLVRPCHKVLEVECMARGVGPGLSPQDHKQVNN